MTLVSDHENDDLNPFRVRSRREVIALLRSIGERNQLVRMVINHGADTIVTSILHIDETNDTVLLDCAPTAIMNQRVLDSKRLSFETVLENIRILFTAPSAEACIYENLPAFVIELPTNVIRLQRREFYRVPTPLTAPVSCIVPYTREGVTTEIATTLHNISGGGISIVDEKKLLGTAIGLTYDNCKIDLPGSGVISVSLQVRNVLELTLTNGKSINRLGCEFIRPSNGTLAVVQKYITKIEREQNAKATGLG